MCRGPPTAPMNATRVPSGDIAMTGEAVAALDAAAAWSTPTAPPGGGCHGAGRADARREERSGQEQREGQQCCSNPPGGDECWPAQQRPGGMRLERRFDVLFRSARRRCDADLGIEPVFASLVASRLSGSNPQPAVVRCLPGNWRRRSILGIPLMSPEPIRGT